MKKRGEDNTAIETKEQAMETLTAHVKAADGTSEAAVEVTEELKKSLNLNDLPSELAGKPVTYRFQGNYLIAKITKEAVAA